MPRRFGAAPANLYYLRCRVAAGSYDAAPILLDAAFNGVAVEQAVPYGMPFVIDAGANITYAPQGPPKPGDVTPLTMALDAKKTADGRWKIVALKFDGDAAKDPGFLIDGYRPPAGGAAGLLAIEGAFLGFGTGFPSQKVVLPGAPVDRESFRLYTLEQNQWQRWKLRDDFDSSSRGDFDVQLDPSAGTVTFGDGENGRVPPELRAPGAPALEQCLIFSQYRSTRAQAGDLAAGLINQLADSPHNRAALSDWNTAKAEMTSIVNPLAAAGGAAAETVAHASGRADSLVKISQRAVTLADYERLARQTPGTHVARVTARANLHPSFPVFEGAGNDHGDRAALSSTESSHADSRVACHRRRLFAATSHRGHACGGCGPHIPRGFRAGSRSVAPRREHSSVAERRGGRARQIPGSTGGRSRWLRLAFRPGRVSLGSHARSSTRFPASTMSRRWS